MRLMLRRGFFLPSSLILEASSRHSVPKVTTELLACRFRRLLTGLCFTTAALYVFPMPVGVVWLEEHVFVWWSTIVDIVALFDCFVLDFRQTFGDLLLQPLLLPMSFECNEQGPNLFDRSTQSVVYGVFRLKLAWK